MLTNSLAAQDDLARSRATRTAAIQRVMIVNGSEEILTRLESLLDEGHYDVVFVESNEHAYSHVRNVKPDLVILCVRIDDPHSLQVLSMLKLDESTRGIPILTYTTESDEPASGDALTEPSDGEIFAPAPGPRMN